MPVEPEIPVLHRISQAISHNPIGALILTTAIISAVFFSTLSLAWNNLNSAALRIDRMAEDIGQIKTSIAKLDTMQSALASIQDTNSDIKKKVDDYRPYEVRLTESFGARVGQNLPVVIFRGQTFAIPQTNADEASLLTLGFRQSAAQFVINNLTANGWLLPTAEAFDLVPTGSTKPKSSKPK
jgi:hypothetical protein